MTTYEALIVYLRDFSGFNYHNIAILLARDERDVRKVYFRAKDKLKRRISYKDAAGRYSSLKVPISVFRNRPLTTYEALIAFLNEEFKIIRGFMTTVHSYTNDQKILDLAHQDLRRARAASVNIIPTTTGATKAVEKCLPELKGKLDGLALRVPTPVVSIVDFVCEVEKETSVEEINNLLEKVSEVGEIKNIFGFEKAPLVSSDYKGNSDSCIVDALSTKVIGGNLIKVLAWYDNEYGYSCRLAEMARYISL